MIYKIVYENINREKFEISVMDELLTEHDKLLISLYFIVLNCRTNKSWKYKIGVSIETLCKWGVFTSPCLFGREMQDNKEKVKTFLIREGFKNVQKMLDENIYEDRELILEWKDYPKIENKKMCLYLIQEGENLRCKISKDYTTFQECEECGVPEDFAKCKNLGNFRANKIETDQGFWYIISGKCLITGKNFEGWEFKDCINKPCFEPITLSSPKLNQIPRVKKADEKDLLLSDLRQTRKVVKGERKYGKHLIISIREKIDNINLFTVKKFGFELFKIYQQKTWNILEDFSCDTEDKFTSHIQSLKDIIDWINIKELEKLVSKKSIKGSINFLETFLYENFPKSDSINPIVETLRKINIIALKFPRHKNIPDLIDAIEFFGEEYPVKDWQKLWNKIIKSFCSILYNLEQLLKGGE